MGIDPGADLFRLINQQEQTVEVPMAGLLLSSKLAELLRVQPGDALDVEVLEGERPKRRIRVQTLITEYSGINAYMNREELNRLMREGSEASGAFVMADASRLDALYAQLKETPGVAGVSLQRAMLASFEETIAENLLMIRSIHVTFAIILSFGVVYNTARVSLAESSRELSTLRVIGFTRGEASAILLGELAVLTGLALPLGWGLGYALSWIVTLGLDTEIYRIPLIVERATFGFATVVVLIGTVISAYIVRRQIDRLDLVGVLKSKG